MGIITKSTILVGYDYKTIKKLQEEYCGPHADELEELYDWDQISPCYDSDPERRVYGVMVATSGAPINLLDYDVKILEVMISLTKKWGVSPLVYVGADVF